MVFLFISVGLNIAIMVLQVKLPKVGICCPAVRSQPEQYTGTGKLANDTVVNTT